MNAMSDDKAPAQTLTEKPGAVLEAEVPFEDHATLLRLVGALDVELRTLEKESGVAMSARGDVVKLKGQPGRVSALVNVLEDAKTLLGRGVEVKARDMAYALSRHDSGFRLLDMLEEAIVLEGGRRVVGRTANQAAFIKAMRQNDIVVGIGPAGTGKTYLAAAMALSWLEKKDIRRIVLTRPAVESGEKLGYLPGDHTANINPYLRPLYDALHLLMGPENLQRLLERDIVEIAPLGFMRGRTFTQCVAILDEAQNTTSDQMRMFLTRLGPGSRAIINGDVSQIDLPKGQVSGLVEAGRKLRQVQGLGFVDFNKGDIVRHPLVERIVAAYENAAGEGEAAP